MAEYEYMVGPSCRTAYSFHGTEEAAREELGSPYMRVFRRKESDVPNTPWEALDRLPPGACSHCPTLFSCERRQQERTEAERQKFTYRPTIGYVNSSQAFQAIRADFITRELTDGLTEATTNYLRSLNNFKFSLSLPVETATPEPNLPEVTDLGQKGEEIQSAPEPKREGYDIDSFDYWLNS